MIRLLRIATAPALGLFVSVVLLVQTRGLDEVARPGQLGPGFWPRLILGGLALSCLAKLVIDTRAAYGAVGARPAAPRPAISRTKVAVSVGLLVLYALLTPLTGFALATLAFIAGFMWISGARSVPVIVGNVILGTAGVLYLFVKFVYLPLPKGSGPFETVTLVLYRALRLF